ncbi:hypothetical protein Emag_000708 [Eimeria magna]
MPRRPSVWAPTPSPNRKTCFCCCCCCCCCSFCLTWKSITVATTAAAATATAAATTAAATGATAAATTAAATGATAAATTAAATTAAAATATAATATAAGRGAATAGDDALKGGPLLRQKEGWPLLLLRPTMNLKLLLVKGFEEGLLLSHLLLLLPLLLLQLLLLHIHPSCSALACGQEAPCSGYWGPPHNSVGRRIGIIGVRGGGPLTNQAAWRVLLLSHQQQQQQQRRQLQQEGRPVGFVSLGASDASRLTGSIGRLSCKSPSSGAQPAAAAAARAAAAAADALLVPPLHPGRQTEASRLPGIPSERTVAACPLYAAAAREAAASAAAAAASSAAAIAAAAPAAYGSRKYRLVLLVSGKLSVSETQSRVREVHIHLLRLQGKSSLDIRNSSLPRTCRNPFIRGPLHICLSYSRGPP